MATKEQDPIRQGVYNVEYFSGAQVSVYIGDVWVDEITTISYSVQQSRAPIYGYASTHFDDLSEGHVLVQGTFTINYKEAGYLWLILNRFREMYTRKEGLLKEAGPFRNSGFAERNNIEQIVNNEISTFDRNQALVNLASEMVNGKSSKTSEELNALINTRNRTRASLGGFASSTRNIASLDTSKEKEVGTAENKFEAFEDRIWQASFQRNLDLQDRRADDPRLNPFEMYITFGDFAGDNKANHTIERLRNVSILGKAKAIAIDGMPIQEQYQFIARNIV